jgi:hypothetical protein
MWIAYATTGQEFNAQEACEVLGITATVPRRVDLIRHAKRRYPDAVTSPYLPNYLFISGTDDTFHAICDIKELRGTAWAVPEKAVRSVAAFIDRIDADYAARVAQIEAGQRVQEYEPGDLLTLMTGQFAGQLATFRRMVEAPGALFPRIEAELALSLLGRPVVAIVDPINARRAG